MVTTQFFDTRPFVGIDPIYERYVDLVPIKAKRGFVLALINSGNGLTSIRNE